MTTKIKGVKTLAGALAGAIASMGNFGNAIASMNADTKPPYIPVPGPGAIRARVREQAKREANKSIPVSDKGPSRQVRRRREILFFRARQSKGQWPLGWRQLRDMARKAGAA